MFSKAFSPPGAISDNWHPRSKGFSGVMIDTSGRFIAIRNSNNPVSFSLLSRIASIPASSNISIAASNGAIPITGALLICHPSAV